MPATCVPWPPSSTVAGSEQERSGSSSHGPSINGMSVVKFRLRDLLTLSSRSGWLASMPVSMMPTRTFGLPGCTAYEPCAVASIISMPHWRSANGSAPALVLTVERHPALADPSASTSSTFSRNAGSEYPITLFREAPAMACSAVASRTNPALLVVTLATPIEAISSTT